MRAEWQIARLMATPAVQAAFAAIDASVPEVVRQTLALSRVPSPTFYEDEKARVVCERFRSVGLRDVRIDAVGNALGRRPGNGGGGAVLLAAHIDTVFPAGTPLDSRRENGYLRGPAVGDNSLGVASLLALASALDQAGITTERDLLFAADVGEEGLGDLRGMKEIMRHHGKEVTATLALEGHTLGRVTHRAVGSRRLRITVAGPGGHSWGDFGRPNAIHVLAQIITQLAHLPIAAEPRSSFNVGRVEGGVSINTIAPSAWCELDIRSEEQAELERLMAWIAGVLKRRQPREIDVRVETVGDRPAGSIAEDAPIVAICSAALRALGIEPTLEASSTDANVPISLGIPAVCLGITRGGGAHRTDEFIEIGPIASGLRQLVLTTMALAAAK